MSEITKSIDAVIALGLAASLKAVGFRKAGRTWHKAIGEDYLIVNVQASSGNVGSDGKFTINLGVYNSEIAKLTGAATQEKPKEYQAIIRERIGPISYGHDHWWEIHKNTDLSVVSADVVEKMEKYGLPWLDNHQSISSISQALKQQPSLQSVAAALIAEGKEEALARLRFALVKRPAAKAGFTSWATKNDLAP